MILNGIIIDEIRFENYRQYGTGILRFPREQNYSLSILIAQNGTGKTTLLNAITWCLYGKELQLLDNDKALPVLNTKILKDTMEGEVQDVQVTLCVLDGDKIIEFNRKKSFIPRMGEDGVKKVIDGPEEFTVAKTVQKDFSNTKLSSGVDAEFLRKQYFHDDIYDFYFFDGENLKLFFTPGREKNIKRSIYNISQVSLLQNVTNHVAKLISTYTHELGKDSPDIELIQTDIESQEKTKRRHEDSRDEANRKISELTAEQNDIDDKLVKFKPVSDLQKERASLESEAEKIKDAQKTLMSERSAFIRRYAVLINLYPRMKAILKYIDEKEVQGDLPPSIDIDQVKDLLDQLNGNLDQPCPCPICNHEIGETGRDHLERLLEKASVSSRTSNFLKEIKGTLQDAVEELKLYRQKRRNITDRETEIEENERRVTNRLDEIAKMLINYENSNYEKRIDVPKLEARRNKIKDQIRIYDQTIGAAGSGIKLCEDEIKRLQKKLEEVKSKLAQSDKTKQKLEVVEMMQRYYMQILANITGGMREEIEETTRQIFESMNWKTQSFGKMEIDDNYSVTVFNPDGLPMTYSLGATEQMALAYAFILAIHKASGRNCPLVIDSPIGRSSDKNREDIAEALLEISKEKQIIMLFTPDDYTIPVQKMYTGKAYIKELSLSKDEKFVEGIDK